jgi:hypothetical protein
MSDKKQKPSRTAIREGSRKSRIKSKPSIPTPCYLCHSRSAKNRLAVRSRREHLVWRVRVCATCLHRLRCWLGARKAGEEGNNGYHH